MYLEWQNSQMAVKKGRLHHRFVLAYMVLVIAHFVEHLLQLAQVFVFDWARSEAGGMLGLYFSGVAENEVLHISYNSFQLTGLILLSLGFRQNKLAFRFWMIALVAQSWHWLEHAFLILQMLTGYYFYGAIKQMSILERFVPRMELHFIYNFVVFVPTIVAIIFYVRVKHDR